MTNLKQLRRRARARAYTLIEVMMALTVLVIGILGIVALQRGTVVSNLDAQQMTIGSNVARVWIERLQAEATRWNHPSQYSSTSDLSNDTFYLKQYTAGGWFLPTQSPTVVGTYSAEFDRTGMDIGVGSTADIIYCANIRLTAIYNDPLCQGPTPLCASNTPSLLRAEVRVYWNKNHAPINACSGAVGVGGTDTVGGDDIDYHWVYAVTTIGKVTAQ